MPTAIDTVVLVTSDNRVASPATGARAAVVHLEVLELDRAGGVTRTLGSVTFGDLLTLVSTLDPSLVLDVVARRAVFGFLEDPPATPLDTVPAELVPLMTQGHGGVLHQRERLIRQGDRLRLRAVVEKGPSSHAILRDDLAPVRLDQVLGD